MPGPLASGQLASGGGQKGEVGERGVDRGLSSGMERQGVTFKAEIAQGNESGSRSQRLSLLGALELGRPWGWVGGAGNCGARRAPPGGDGSLGGPCWGPSPPCAMMLRRGEGLAQACLCVVWAGTRGPWLVELSSTPPGGRGQLPA